MWDFRDYNKAELTRLLITVYRALRDDDLDRAIDALEAAGFGLDVSQS